MRNIKPTTDSRPRYSIHLGKSTAGLGLLSGSEMSVVGCQFFIGFGEI
jgi:hypothetical protein